MIVAPQIERASLADLGALARQREVVGWYPNEALLRAALAWDGTAMFVIRAGALEPPVEGDPHEVIATTSALAAPPMGVIGNVSVRPDAQRRGLARRIMVYALDWLRAHGVRQVYLDATTFGRPLYSSLGFTEVCASWFASVPLGAVGLDRLRAVSGDQSPTSITACPSEDTVAALDALADLDRAAFGGDRLGLLREVMEPTPSSPAHLYLARDRAGSPQGYAITRWLHTPRPVIRLGPLVATGDDVAAALTLAAVQAARGVPHHSDAPPTLFASGGLPTHTRVFFDRVGLTPEDDDVVMRLDLQPLPPGTTPAALPAESLARETAASSGASTRQRPAASVYSWIAPMVF